MKKIILNLIAIVVLYANANAQTATINLSAEKQTIQGFGGMNHPTWIGDLTESQRKTAFENGDGQIGMTILRMWIDSNSSNWSRELPTAKWVQQNGGLVFATAWNPPTSMTEEVNRNNRTEKRLKPESYNDYVNHLNDYNNYMKNNGVNLYGICFANEPDYGHDWTWYSIDEVYNFTKNYAGKLRINGTKVISAESFCYQKSYYDKILNDEQALNNIDIIGTHFYASDANTSNSFFQYELANTKAPNKELWMTEHYTSSDPSPAGQDRADVWPEALDVSYEIHRAMAEGNFSAYIWWYIRRFYGPIKDDGTISKRGYCMAQYSKFVRPGYVRVEADNNPTYNVYVSAYKNNDDVVIVAVNRSTVSKTLTFSIPGTKVETWEKYVTSGTKNLAKESNVNSTSGSFLITLDPQSTTTFVGKASKTSTSGSPSISITSPTSGASFSNTSIVNLTVNATDADGRVEKVEFYNGSTKIGESNVSPYSFRWTGVADGSYSITAVATDNDGNKTTVSLQNTQTHLITQSATNKKRKKLKIPVQ